MTNKITSFKEFHRLVPKIVQQINANPELAIRGTVNPLLAIEELGYDLAPEVLKQLERILRFQPAERKRIKELEQKKREQKHANTNQTENRG